MRGFQSLAGEAANMKERMTGTKRMEDTRAPEVLLALKQFSRMLHLLK